MVIKCIKNNSVDIPDWNAYNSVPLDEVLEINKEYIVYGIAFINGEIQYYINTSHEFYPKAYPAVLFEVLEQRLSRYFEFGTYTSSERKTIPFISFKEWVNDPTFYSELVDSEPEPVKVFDHYKLLLYLEHRAREVQQSAVLIQDNWVQCPVCTDAWKLEHPDFEMCRCPKCDTTLVNPILGRNGR